MPLRPLESQRSLLFFTQYSTRFELSHQLSQPMYQRVMTLQLVHMLGHSWSDCTSLDLL